MVMISCQACGTINRTRRKFCSHCGSQLGWPCMSCGFFNYLGEQYCGECGRADKHATVREQPRPSMAARAPEPAPVAERGYAPPVIERGYAPVADPAPSLPTGVRLDAHNRIPEPRVEVAPPKEPEVPLQPSLPAESGGIQRNSMLSNQIGQYIEAMAVDKPPEEEEDTSGTVSQEDVNKLFS